MKNSWIPLLILISMGFLSCGEVRVHKKSPEMLQYLIESFEKDETYTVKIVIKKGGSVIEEDVVEGLSLDTTLPDVPLSPEPELSITNSSDIAFFVPDPLEGITFSYRLNGTDTVPISETNGKVIFNSSADGNYSCAMQAIDEIGNESEWSYPGGMVTVDSMPPVNPSVTVPSPTSNPKPTFSWVSGGGGSGVFRIQLDPGGWNDTDETSFTPGTALSNGSHTLHVKERDEAGNWSTEGSATVTVDTSNPGVPVITGTTPTNDPTPTWNWTSGGGIGEYQYSLDGVSFTSTTSTTFTPSSNLSDGAHTLLVKEKNAVGTWSAEGSFTITVDTVPPGVPVVTGTTPTTNKTPTWTWTPGGGGNGNFRRRLNGGSWQNTTASFFTPTSELSLGNHTLGVQERDSAGNWSQEGTFTITVQSITPAKPNPPVVTGTTPTTDTTPTWNWTSGGGGGNGTFRYKLDNSDLSSGATETTETSFTPASALSEGAHTLYVQEKNNSEVWSDSGLKTISINLSSPVTPDDPYFSVVDNSWGQRSIGALLAWNFQTDCRAKRVAVIDTGVDAGHDDLVNNVNTSLDYDFVNDDSNAMDDHGHGTHVAGTIAAEGNNSIGTAGVCWRAEIIPVKVLSATGSGTTSDVVEGIHYALDNNAKVLNLSLGSLFSACHGNNTLSCFESNLGSATDAIIAAGDNGAIILAAAGNGGEDGVGDNNDNIHFVYSNYSKFFNHVIGVASVSCEPGGGSSVACNPVPDLVYLSVFSNYGVGTVTLAAPGSRIVSCYPRSKCNSGTSCYVYFSGTSMATPMVSGAAALLWGFAPSSERNTIVNLIKNNVSVDSFNNSGSVKTGGVLDLNAAVRESAGL